MSSTDDELRARRERLERLLAVADRVVRQQVGPRERPWWLPYSLMAGASAIVLVLMFVTGGGSGTGSASTTVLPTSPPVTTSPSVVITLSPTTVPVVVPSTSQVATTTTWVAPAGQPVRWSVYEAGVVTLHGSVPDIGTGQQLVAMFAAAVGADRVMADYAVTPGVPVPGDEILTAPDAMQFEAGSSDLQPAATQFLDMLAAFMTANSQVTVEIGTYTDDVGPADANLSLTQARAAAILGYLEARGILATRLTGTGYGEAAPIADNGSEAGRVLNRRVEFTLHHLFD